MKVLQIACGFSYSTVYNKLFSELERQNLQLQVYVPQHKVKSLKELKCDEYTFPIYSNKIIKKYDKLLYYSKIRRMVKDIELNFNLSDLYLIHAHSLFSDGGVAFNLYKKYKIPYIVAIRDTDINKYFKYAIHLRKYALDIMKNAKNIIFISPAYKNYVIDNYIPADIKDEIKIKSKIIPNGIDEYWLKHINTDKNIYNEKRLNNDLKLLYVGVINKRKNINSTVNAIGKLHQKGYDVKFTVVGRVEDTNIYKQLIELPYVNYLEPKPKEELLEIYRLSDIFVMPSITETFGLVYAEAMSQGLPVIYSKGQGFDGQFEEGTVGYSVDSFNFNEISESIINISDNYETIAKNCIQLCEKFNWELIVSKYKKIYEEIGM